MAISIDGVRVLVKATLVVAGIWFGLAGAGVIADAQAALSGEKQVTANTVSMSAQVGSVKVACMVNSSSPNPPEKAFNKGEFDSAEALFRELLAKNADNDVAHEGLVRTLIEQNKVDASAKDVESWVATAPNSSMALTALGDVRLRQGEPRKAVQEFQKAALKDPCNARAFYGIAEVDGLAGLHATAQQRIEQAYALHPTDDEIYTSWLRTRPRKERLAKWADYAEHSDQISEDERAKLKTRLEKESQYHPTDCRMTAESPQGATVPMAAVREGISRFVSWGLDIKLNGKQRRLQIDTGASGITISRVAAMFIGIEREDVKKTSGFGDKGEVKTSITHVASIKIGRLEFTNCPVKILEKWSVLDTDGLIGSDVFSDSQVTLDFPKHELRIAPLPERPGETNVASSSSSDDEMVESHDPYIAPEMAKWQRVYRSGHDLLMPVGIIETKRVKDESAWKDKLFLLDTGSSTNLITPAAAKEVTKLSRDYDTGMRGISGEVEKVFEAGKFTVAFAGLVSESPYMTAVDMTPISHSAGVEVSGVIGAPALYQMVMHIDYRDNLVWCEYPLKEVTTVDAAERRARRSR